MNVYGGVTVVTPVVAGCWSCLKYCRGSVHCSVMWNLTNGCVLVAFILLVRVRVRILCFGELTLFYGFRRPSDVLFDRIFVCSGPCSSAMFSVYGYFLWFSYNCSSGDRRYHRSSLTEFFCVFDATGAYYEIISLCVPIRAPCFWCVWFLWYVSTDWLSKLVMLIVFDEWLFCDVIRACRRMISFHV